MQLRTWQKECINTITSLFNAGQRHCLVTATPGSGKTILAAQLANKMLDNDDIDLVLCLAPSVEVATGFATELERSTGLSMNGLIGSYGQACTYHSLAHMTESFWSLFKRLRVLVIFDEIHHCGGSDIDNSTAWGEILITQIQDNACFTLALSGTPWRSDKLPVALNHYCDQSGKLRSDYSYPLTQAIEDNVCRTPIVVAIDNSDLRYESLTGAHDSYQSISELMSSGVAFQLLLISKPLVSYMLKQAIFKLAELHYSSPDAAGLVVASSIEHAHFVADILMSDFGQKAIVITSDDKRAIEKIRAFRDGSDRWVVSVGMISEGTNIPRLQVCCYLSRVKTELYFRQVLGRILRMTNKRSKHAYLYIFAEPTLLSFARRLDQDIPDECSLIDVRNKPLSNPTGNYLTEMKDKYSNGEDDSTTKSPEDPLEGVYLNGPEMTNDRTKDHGLIPKRDITIFGTFFNQLIALEALTS